MKPLLKDNVVLVTTTCSKSIGETRAQLALKTSHAAAKQGYPIIVIDGSPCQKFKRALQKMGAVVIDEMPPGGMGASRRQALLAGIDFGSKVIVWLEPEKYTLVPLLQPSIERVSSGTVDVAVPRRKNLEGYPRYQQLSELRANWEICNLIGRTDLDIFFGPRVMTPDAARMMAGYNGRCGENSYNDNWETLIIPILWLLKTRSAIESVLVDYVHPPEQIVEDDETMRAKRDAQRIQIVDAIRRETARIRLKGL